MAWQKATGYGRRSLIETAIGRYKSLISPRLRARTLPAQQGEIVIAVEALNQMIRVAKPSLALPHPWCIGFLSAMQLRLKTWEPLLDPSCPDHALTLPILLYCTDALGGPTVEPPGESTEMHQYMRGAYHDIPIVIPAIREFWMPKRAVKPESL